MTPQHLRLSWLALVATLLNCEHAFATPTKFFVATNGNDRWSGQLAAPNRRQTDGPFASLERARDEIRARKAARRLEGGATVYLRRGFYSLQKPIALTEADSGSERAPIIYRAWRGEEVRLAGGRDISGLGPVTDPEVFGRLEATASPHLRQIDLKTLGISDFGDPVAAGQRPELFFEEKPMMLARWPNEGFVRIAEVVGGSPYTVHGLTGDKVGKLAYDGDRPKRWSADNDIRLHGYWFWDWSDGYEKVESIDTAKRVISMVAPYHGYGYRKGQRFYVLNLLSELDVRGEWFQDRQKGILYFWPPPAVAGGRAVISNLPTLLTLRDTSWVTFRGLILEATRGTAITMTGGTNNSIAGCTIRNTGSWAVTIAGGASNAVVGRDIYQTGEGGVSLEGGDRRTLTASGHRAENNHIHHFGRLFRTYRPAVALHGVGHHVAHNLMHDAPHTAIQLSGNDHRIEFNEVHSVCYETGDVGAFYMGRDWTERGTVIRHNFFHHIEGPGLHGAMAVYLDDSTSGVAVYGNVFYRAGRAAFIGGGRDNLVENNIFVECQPAVHVDARGLNWMKYHVEGEGTLPTRLKDILRS